MCVKPLERRALQVCDVVGSVGQHQSMMLPRGSSVILLCHCDVRGICVAQDVDICVSVASVQCSSFMQ